MTADTTGPGSKIETRAVDTDPAATREIFFGLGRDFYEFLCLSFPMPTPMLLESTRDAPTPPDPYARARKSGEFERLRRRMTRQVEATMHQFSMLDPGDHIMICCSGGKDSYTLLTILQDLARRKPFDFRITAFNLDQAQPGFPQETLPAYFAEVGVAHLCHREDTYAIVKAKTAPGKTTCALCSRLRRGIIYTKAAEIGATKIALGHHRDDVIETLLLNMFFGARLKAMPPKLAALSGQHTLIRPLYACAEADIGRFARAMAYPIIPCNLCGTQPNLQRQAFKTLLSEFERTYPGRRQAIFKALSHLFPSHLADQDLFDFAAMQPRPSTRSAPHINRPDPGQGLAAAAAAPRGFMALLEPTDTDLDSPTLAVSSPWTRPKEAVV